jgi:hypothetical protein
MGLVNGAREKWIRFFINPFQKREPLDFKKTLKKASRILILLPASDANRVTPRILSQAETAFPGSLITLVHPGSGGPSEGKTLSHPVLYLHMNNRGIRQLLRSQVLMSCARDPYDLLFDLDPDFNPVGYYLARLKPGMVSVGFVKPYSARYYRIQYNASKEANFEEKASCLFQFMKGFVPR